MDISCWDSSQENNHSLTILCVNAAKADCGSLCAMRDSCLISSIHFAIFCLIDSFIKVSLPIGVPKYFVPSVVIVTLCSAMILVASSRYDGFVTSTLFYALGK